MRELTLVSMVAAAHIIAASVLLGEEKTSDVAYMSDYMYLADKVPTLLAPKLLPLARQIKVGLFARRQVFQDSAMLSRHLRGVTQLTWDSYNRWLQHGMDFHNALGAALVEVLIHVQGMGKPKDEPFIATVEIALALAEDYVGSFRRR